MAVRGAEAGSRMSLLGIHSVLCPLRLFLVDSLLGDLSSEFVSRNPR